MDKDKYPVFDMGNALEFEFVSEGPKGKIVKMVRYSTTEIPGMYNFAFGDKNHITGGINDLTRTNNGDTEKVLATVASTLLIFSEHFPGAAIYAEGSTMARNRLYRMGISNNYEQIRAYFEILGRKNDQWFRFKKNIEFDAFLARRKF